MTAPRHAIPVTLRRATSADAPTLLAWRREPSAARFQPLRDRPLDDLRHELEIDGAKPIDAAFDGSGRFIVVAGGEDAGWVTLQRVDRDDRTASVGYTIAERFRARGIATAAVRAVIDIAFGPLGIERLGAVAAVENIASRRVLERSGFRFEGIARGLLVIAGERVDHATYGLLVTDHRPFLNALATQE